MKKILLLISLTFIFYGCTNQSSALLPNDTDKLLEEEYLEKIENFTKITDISELKNLSNDRNIYVYTGRKTCPYCQIFVPKLSDAQINTSTEIFYIDSEKNDDNIQQFFQKHDMRYVPDLSIFKNGEKIETLDIDSQNITIDEISSFLKI